MPLHSSQEKLWTKGKQTKGQTEKSTLWVHYVSKALATYLMRAFLNTCSDFLLEKTEAGEFIDKKFAYLSNNAEKLVCCNCFTKSLI